jgi:hypothetical protein
MKYNSLNTNLWSVKKTQITSRTNIIEKRAAMDGNRYMQAPRLTHFVVESTQCQMYDFITTSQLGYMHSIFSVVCIVYHISRIAIIISVSLRLCI